ncbi:MAG: hypothetical protein HY040_06605 [Planctomycetes bacterium]|nr:hypothetical protein [Planctomycetota bacterium]
MRRNQKVLMSLPGLLAFMGVGVIGILCVTAPRHRITKESFAKIRAGMTLPEIEEVLGGPSGDYGPGKIHPFVSLRAVWTEANHFLRWSAADVDISIAFKNGEAIDMYLDEASRMEETLAERIRRWLGLPWW